MMRTIKFLLTHLIIFVLISGLSFADINLKLGDNIDSLKMKGDLRVRFERHDQDKDALDKKINNNPKDRFRTRFRLGLNWDNPTEKWELAAGLCTGTKGSTSTNDTWSYDEAGKASELFDTGDIRLDYAYAKHSIDKLTLIVGQQKIPFETSWLLWDSDVRPAGFTGKIDMDVAFGMLGIYDFIQNENDIGMLFSLQGGTKMELGNISFLGAMAAYIFNNNSFNDQSNDEAYDRPNKDYEFRIIDLYGEVTVKLDKKISVSPYLHLFKNIGADGKKGEGLFQGSELEPDSESLGWVLGVSGKLFDASYQLAYAQIGADSCIPDLKNGDFGSKLHDGVNVQGFVIGGGYKITKHFGAEITGYFYEQLEDPFPLLNSKEDSQNMQLIHIDLKYKF